MRALPRRCLRCEESPKRQLELARWRSPFSTDSLHNIPAGPRKPGHLLCPSAALGFMVPPGSPDYIQSSALSPSLKVPYHSDLLSNGRRVQAAVEVLNPLGQFFFPGSDKDKEVIRGHLLGKIQMEKASGTKTVGSAGIEAYPGRATLRSFELPLL